MKRKNPYRALLRAYRKEQPELFGVKPHKLKRHRLLLPAIAKRRKIVKFLYWAAANKAQIHYAEIRPIPQVKPGQFPKLPLATDCSGLQAMAEQYAGLDWFEVNGEGYTGTTLSRAKQIFTDVSEALPGDPIVIGPGTGAHEVGVVKRGRDPLVCSHGDESGPNIQRLSADGRTPKRVCRYL